MISANGDGKTTAQHDPIRSGLALFSKQLTLGAHIPLGVGRVSDVGFIAADDMIVQWPELGMQGGPEWLVLVGKEH
jgi:hypothetical protein